MSRLRAEDRIRQITDKNISAQIIYDITLEATEDEQKASEAMDQWVNTLQKQGKDPSGCFNVDTMNILSGVSTLFKTTEG